MQPEVEGDVQAQDGVHVGGHPRGGHRQEDGDDGQGVGDEALQLVHPVEHGPVLVVGRGPKQPACALQQGQAGRHAAEDAVQAGGRGPALEVDERGDDGRHVQHHRQHHQQPVPREPHGLAADGGLPPGRLEEARRQGARRGREHPGDDHEGGVQPHGPPGGGAGAGGLGQDRGAPGSVLASVYTDAGGCDLSAVRHLQEEGCLVQVVDVAIVDGGVDALHLAVQSSLHAPRVQQRHRLLLQSPAYPSTTPVGTRGRLRDVGVDAAHGEVHALDHTRIVHLVGLAQADGHPGGVAGPQPEDEVLVDDLDGDDGDADAVLVAAGGHAEAALGDAAAILELVPVPHVLVRRRLGGLGDRDTDGDRGDRGDG